MSIHGGKDTCIPRRRDCRYFTIDEDKLRICDMNKCMAAILSMFVYWTDNQLTNQGLSADDRPEGVWFPHSIKDFRNDVLGCFSESSIEEALKGLSDKEIICIERPNPKMIGEKCRYRLRIDALSDMLTALPPLRGRRAIVPHRETPNRKASAEAMHVKSTVSNNTDGKSNIPSVTILTAVSNNTDGPSVTILTPNKEENNSENISLEYSPNPQKPKLHFPCPRSSESPNNRLVPDVNLETLPLPPPEETANVLPRDVDLTIDADKLLGIYRGGKVARLGRAERAQFVEAFSKLDYPHTQVEAALRAYLANMSDWLVEHKHPWRVFLTQIDRWIAAGDAELAQEPSELVRWASTMGRAEKIEPSPVSASNSGIPEPVERWNEIVPEDIRVLTWDRFSPVAELRKAETDPDFRARLDDIAKKCVAIRQSGKMDNPPTFAWLFQGKPKPNWERLLCGTYDWAMGSGRKANSAEGMKELVRARQERLRRSGFNL